MELLLGCGSNRDKKLYLDGDKEWKELITLDFNEDHKPDVCHDLEMFPYPFDDNQFDEIHAYEVLEHTGAQGDWAFFFRQFSELWRITKPNGLLFATVPKWDSVWAWSDPSHTRVISHGTLVFLDQDEYEKQVGKTAMSDFRDVYKANWRTMHAEYKGEGLGFVLKAIK